MITVLAVVGLVVGTNVASAAPVVSTGLALHTINPVRVLDTRTGTGGSHAPVSAGGVLTLTVAAVPEEATAIAINVTAVNGTRPSYLTLYAAGTPLPPTSTVNWADRPAAANGAVVALSADDKINIRNNAGTVDVVIDLVGYYSPAPAGAGPAGPAGPVGPKGETGAVGPVGPEGETGLAGAMGAMGLMGATGDVGPVGATGDVGPAGSAGAKGDTGDTGAPGPVGPAGATGDTGDTGAPGPVGPVGPAGVKGDAGDVGPAGPKGDTGPAGPKGDTGTPGTAGAKGDTGAAGAKGDTGSAGPKGDKGDPGATGAAGPAGPAGTGTAGGGAILAASGGGAKSLTTLAGGLVGQVALLPLAGSTGIAGTLSGGNLDGSASGDVVQVFPRDGTVTSISARFSTTAALTLIGTTGRLSAQLYTSSSGSNTLTPVAGASCTLGPPLTGVIAVGATSSCTTTGLNIPVTNQTAGVLVFSATTSGIAVISTFTGYVSASLSVS